jgi:hypothetical protein
MYQSHSDGLHGSMNSASREQISEMFIFLLLVYIGTG